MLPLLTIQNLQVDFCSETGTTNAVKGISLTVNSGELVALVGESGSGKSVTALSVLQLLPKPTTHYNSGKILFTNNDKTVDLLKLSDTALQQIRGNHIGMIFQEPMTSLNPVISCGVQVMEAILVHKRTSKREARRQTIAWFEKVKLPNPEGIFNRYPHQLSGGQKQRVMIAMAMCCNPLLLTCDEPTTALDVTVQKTILQLIKDLQREQNLGIIFITHDLGVVAEIADRVVIMYKGEIVEEGKTADIFKQAKHPYTQALIACRPALHPKGERLPMVSDYMSGVQKQEAGSQKSEAGMISERAPATPLLQYHTTPAFIEVRNLTVKFPARTSFFGKPLAFNTAVDDVSFDIHPGETLGLVGESGCGKTTVGRTLLRLVQPTSGSIRYNGTNLTQLSKTQVKELHKNVQLVFQDPYSSLNPRLTIESAIAEAMMVAGIHTSSRERHKAVGELLEKVSLPAAAASRYPHQFSGGQRQRIVIARALALNPGFLVCDESVSALDVSVQAQVLNLLNDLKKELGLTLLFISHDLSVVRYMCDRIMVMQAGHLIESGPAEDVYNHPQSRYTKTLLAAIPRLNPQS